jgi:hypothetical protein
MKKINHLILAFGILICSNATAQYVADPAFTNDFAGRPGHSNSNLTNPPSGGGMAAPKCILQDGSYVFAAGKTLDNNYSGYILNRKNGSTGVNLNFTKLNYGFLTTGIVNTDEIIPFAMTADAGSNRLYVVGRTTNTAKGIICCFRLDNLQLVTGFNSTGILLMESSSTVIDILVKDVSNLLTVRNLSNEIKVSEINTTGAVGLTFTLSAAGKSYFSSRLKKYPGMSTRYFITGYVDQSGTKSPGIWGIDYITGGHGSPASMSLICHNALQLFSEGPGEFLDLCFPYNSSTLKYDIVCVGRTVALNTPASSGMYVKYKGNTSTGPAFNLAFDNTYKNQASLPGTGYASNIADPTNMTVFTGCEVIGTQVAVVGCYKVGANSPHDAIVGFINAAGTSYSKEYIPPANSSTGYPVHYPGRLWVNAQNQILVIACDFGLTAFKLKP